MAERDRSARIEALVRAAVRRHRAVRAAEGLLVGLSAAGLTAAALSFWGARPWSGAALAAAALAGLSGAAAWGLARRRTRAQLVRRIDRATLADGALVTAFECAQRPDPNALEAALVERAARAADPRAARRAIAPPAPGLLAAPLVAAALLTLALERRPAGGGEGPALEALRALSVELGGAGAAGSGAALDPELERLLERALALAARPERGAALERALAELEAGLERRAAQAPGELALDLARAASLARAARGRPGGLPSPDSLPADRSRLPGQAGTGPADGDAEDAGGAAAGPGLAGGPAGATMAGSTGVADAAGDPPGAEPAPGPTGEAGVLAGHTWDAQYDGVVSAWVLRAAAARSGERSLE